MSQEYEVLRVGQGLRASRRQECLGLRVIGKVIVKATPQSILKHFNILTISTAVYLP